MADTTILNVGFKMGSQNNVNKIINNGDGAIEGSFYLTDDTHRLYIGAKNEAYAGIENNSKVTLYSVSDGIITVRNISDINSNEAIPGAFYYLSEPNAFVIYNGNGKYAQINVDTDNTIKSISNDIISGLKEDEKNQVEWTTTVHYADEIGDGIKSSPIKIIGDGGLQVSYSASLATDEDGNEVLTNKTITLKNDVYKLESSVGITGNENEYQALKLDLSSEGGNDSTVTLRTSNNGLLSFENKGNNTVDLSVENPMDGAYLSITSQEVGYAFDLLNGNNDSLLDLSKPASLNPKISYGYATTKNAEGQVIKSAASNFNKNNLNLEVYTIEEIDEMINSLNGMTYKGTIGTNGTFADKIEVNSSGGYNITRQGSIVRCHVGDMALLNTDIKNLKGNDYSSGTLFIFNGDEEPITLADGKKDSVIKLGTLEFDAISGVQAVDTQYYFTPNGVDNGIALAVKNQTGSYEGSINVAQNPLTVTDEAGTTTTDVESLNINVTQNHTKNTSGDGYDALFKVQHDTRTINTRVDESKKNQGEDNGYFKLSVYQPQGDRTGHIKEIVEIPYQIPLGQSYFDSDDTAPNLYITTAREEKYSNGTSLTVGAVQNTITLSNTMSEDPTTATNTFLLTSKTLKIADDDTHGVNNDNDANKKPGLSIDMVWGSF